MIPLDRSEPKCGIETVMHTDARDPGKCRTCERKKGHTGRHMTYYCGKRRFWLSTPDGNLPTPTSRF